MRKTLVFFLMAMVSLFTKAQSDFEIAAEFMSKKGITLVDNKARTRSASSAYSIFNANDGNGFAIVLNGSVVGYSTNTSLDEANMPCGLEEMLSHYPKVQTRSDYDWFIPRDIEPIKPLLTTKWNQTFPYNEMAPEKTNICAVIAYAQLLHYFRVPQTYCDFEYTYEDWGGYGYFPITEFDHDKMLDVYVEGQYTQDEVNEVAKFCNYIMWGFAYGVNSFDVFNLTNNLMQSYEYEYKYELIDESLENGIPLWWMGNNHAYVIDGRDSEGRYHVNFGWGGAGDGYFEIPDRNDIDPSVSGLSEYVVHPSVFNQLIPNWSWTSSVTSIKIPSASDGIAYNLQGQMVGNSLKGLPNGIYVVNGKKHFVKH